MHAALIYAPTPLLLDDHIDPPFGLITIGTLLQKAGHKVTIADMSHPDGAKVPDADIYGLSVFTANYDVSLGIARSLGSKPVVAGGPHASALPQEALRDGYGAVVVGECEGNIVDLMERIAGGERGVFQGEPVNDLDSLPFWNYGLVDMPSFGRLVDGEKAFDYMPGRGCPYRCKFCWTAHNRIKVRLHSVERIMEELRRNNARHVRFFDDNFGMNKKHSYSLCDALGEAGIKYRCTPRVTDLSKEFCRRLKDSGCLLVNFGAESGSETMLLKMDKRQTPRQIKEGVETAKEAGLKVRIGLIVGFPGETWETIEESVNFLKTVPFDDFNPYLFVPFPGTEPYHQPEKYGITWLSKSWSDYHILSGDCVAHVAFESEGLDRQTLMDMWQYVKAELSRHADTSMVDKKYASFKYEGSCSNR